MSGFMKFLLSFLIFVVLCFFGLRWYVNEEVGKELSHAVAETPGLDFSYADLSVNILDHTVTLNRVDTLFPSGQHVQADKLQIIAYDQKNPVPYFITATATGLVIPVTNQNFGPWANYLNGLGIKALSGEGKLDYVFNPDTNILEIKDVSLNDPKLGILHLSGAINNLEPGTFRLEQCFALGINQVRIQFTNHSFMQLVTASWAKSMGMSEATTLARISAELEGMAEYATKQENHPAENATRGLQRFLNDPGTLTVTASPNEPVPVLYFFMGRDLFENLRLLNIKVETDSSDGI